MIETVLNKYIQLSAKEVQFRLGFRTVIKKANEWVHVEHESLSVSEWDDLKDLCLNAEQKITLETKGQVKGIFAHQNVLWLFSFVEWRDCLKAHFSFLPSEGHEIQLQYPIYWESLKLKSGLHIVSGARGQGKTSFLKSLTGEIMKNSPELIVIHSDTSVLSSVGEDDSVVNLGLDSESWSGGHAIYDGMETVILDKNSVDNWKKWIHFAEEGRRVFITISGTSVISVLLQIWSDISHEPGLWSRFVNQLVSVVNQKVVGPKEGAVHEALVLKSNQKTKLRRAEDGIHFDQFNEHHYQSYNQSITQALVRRRLDVKTAFAYSPDPDELDANLKKMGL